MTLMLVTKAVTETDFSILDILLTIVVAAISSSGAWAFLDKIMAKRSNSNKMLLGLGHDRIMALGMHYISRGYITEDEYDNLFKYLYTPYRNMGGNGTAERIMKEVDKLPVTKNLKEGDN